ncbi:MAG: RluA family pseudouridine synthase [Rhodocyclaceae bacterium]|nr:RluA family pseudouridine synthase [Rhodocyclaceae bacterium]
MFDLDTHLLHLDDDLIVIDKPAGLLSVPGQGADRQDCLLLRVQACFPEALSVHRLDAPTSGVILLARGPEMHRRLNRDFQTRTVGKRYVAVVHGHVADDEGEIDLPLGKDEERRPREKVDPVHGRPARSRYTVIERRGAGAEALTRLELKPLTGRTHQLRVHLLAIGHPIIGDPLYGTPESVARHGRLHLHAAAINLFHPRSRQPVAFESPVPF